MVKIRNTFDGGTNGTGMTVANTGGVSGDAFSAVEATALFSSEQKKSGSLSMKPPLTAASGYGRWTTNSRNNRLAIWIYSTAAITSDYNFMQTRYNSSTSAMTLRVNGANALRAYGHAAAANLWTASAALPLNQWVMVECLYEQGVAANDGRIKVAYYLAGSSTPVQESPWITGINLRGDLGVNGEVYVGKTQTTTNAASFYVDSAAVDTGADYGGVFLGPVAPIVSPAYRWNGSGYVPLKAYRWNSTYIPLTAP